jgi:AraC-like DNA-binding protein
MTTTLGFLGSLQGLILAGAIATLGGSFRRPNRLLALLLATLSVAVGAITAQHAGSFGSATAWILIEYTAAFVAAPALWAYANAVLGERPRVPLQVHGLPLAAWLVLVVATALGAFGSDARSLGWLPPILAIILYLAGYTIVVAIRVLQSSRESGRVLSSHGLVLRAVVVLLLAVHVSQGVRYGFRDVPALSDIVPLTATGMIVVLSVLAYRRSRLFAGHEARPSRPKYAASGLSGEESEKLWTKVLGTMTREKPFLNENFDLAELAARLSVPRSHLSQVVNERSGAGFPEFVNRYRVDEAVRLLGDPEATHFTIEAIGYEVGFRSRSGFYGAFRRLRDETPSETRARFVSEHVPGHSTPAN